MGWDIYFFRGSNKVTKSDILKNEKYKEDAEHSFLYTTYTDSEGNEKQSGLVMEYDKDGEPSYGYANYGVNAIPFCSALYHDFGLIMTEEEILYFDREITPYEEELSEEEINLVWQYYLIFQSYRFGIIDEPNEWIKEAFSKLPQYLSIIIKHKMEFSEVNVVGPGYQAIEEHDGNLDATYKQRMKAKRRNERKDRIDRLKKKIKRLYSKTKKNDDLPF